MRSHKLLIAALATAGAAACGSSPQNTFGTDGGGGGGRDASTLTKDSGGHSLSHDGAGEVTLVGIAITPSTSTLTVTDPTMLPKATLAATAKYSDGSTAPIDATWSLDRLDIAGVAASGVVTPTGVTFGPVHVTATAGGKSAMATVTVNAKLVLNPGMLSTATLSQLAGATTADTAITSFAYPYDAAVFPLGLLPPQQMWNGGAAGDAYSLHYVTTSVDLTVYFTADPPSQLTLPVATWNTLTSSAAGASVAVTLNHLSGTTATTSATQSWKISTANLGGSIYYWAINEGQILKIDLTTGARTNVFASGDNTQLGTPAPFDDSTPASPPWESNGSTGTNTRCVACHSVSKDGSTLTSVFSRAGSQGPLGFIDLATSNVTAVGDYQMDTAFDALTPDGSLAVMNPWGMTMQLLSSATGQPVASALDTLTNVSDPAFSPDGTRLALATNCGPAASGATSIEFHQSDLSFYSFTNAPPYFTNPVTVATSTGPQDTFAFPSFSPDSQLIFFQRGTGSRAKITDPTTGNPTHDTDDLYVAPAAANATPILLANANNPGGVLPADSQHLNYAPTVNPIAAGGYIWVVFTSPRDYGNAMVSPQGAAPMDASYANRKQLWVTAVDANVGTVDPSHPPFWLPGQDLTSINMFGYWALSPCLPTVPASGSDAGASSCSAGFDCCSGFCEASGDAGAVCVANSSAKCAAVGNKCSTSADCCAGSNASCIGGFCQQTTPK